MMATPTNSNALLPIWQPEFGLSYAGLALVRALSYSGTCEWRSNSPPLVTFENSPVFVTADHLRMPGMAGGRAESPRFLLLAGREDAVIKLGELVMIPDLHRQGLSVQRHCPAGRRAPEKPFRTYIGTGLEPPTYKKRAPALGVVDRFEPYLRERLAAYPALTAHGVYSARSRSAAFPAATASCGTACAISGPPAAPGYEVRFETPPGEQAASRLRQVRGRVPRRAGDQTDRLAVLDGARLFPADLGAVRPPPGIRAKRPAPPYRRSGGDRRSAAHDPLRSHEDRGHRRGRRRARQFATTAPLSTSPVITAFSRAPVGPIAAKTKGKVERPPFRYIREDFFSRRRLSQISRISTTSSAIGSETVARNPRVHATTQRVVNEAFAEEKVSLEPLPRSPYRSVLRLERRASHEGMVSVGGNLYSVPDTTRRRVVDVHVLADEIRIFEDGEFVASHLPLDGRGEKRLDPAHRKPGSFSRRRPSGSEPATLTRAGDHVPRRSLDFYAAVGRRLAAHGGTR